MSIQSNERRLKKLEQKSNPGRFYVIRDDSDHVLASPGGYMTKAEFEALALNDKDIVFDVIHVGMDLSKI